MEEKKTDLREVALAVGVNANDADITRVKNRVARGEDLKSLCQNVNFMHLLIYMESGECGGVLLE